MDVPVYYTHFATIKITKANSMPPHSTERQKLLDSALEDLEKGTDYNEREHGVNKKNESVLMFALFLNLVLYLSLFIELFSASQNSINIVLFASFSCSIC